jgi:hypothetical protein
MYPLNTRVRILRGGLDDFPQVKLAGVPGRVCSLHSNALPGMISVWVDWELTQYKGIPDLPRVINNYPADIEPWEESPSATPKLTPKLKLKSMPSSGPVRPDMNEAEPASDEPEPENPRPGGMRLV